MVRVRTVSVRKDGGFYLQVRNIGKAKLKDDYERRTVRGRLVYLSARTLNRLESGSMPIPEGRKGKLPKPSEAATEELIVRERATGGKKGDQHGRPKGRNKPIPIRIVVRIRGNKAERDLLAKGLEHMLMRELPFLKGRGVVGRRIVRGRQSDPQIDVASASFDGKQSGAAKRAIKNELRGELD